MRWNHLPIAGGIYDQHPQLLDEWKYIFEQQADHEKQERDRRKPKTMAVPRRRR